MPTQMVRNLRTAGCPRPVLEWTRCRDIDGFETRWHGETWVRAVTAGKYPWALMCEGKVKQPIGDKHVEAAQDKAAMWLDLSVRYPSGGRM